MTTIALFGAVRIDPDRFAAMAPHLRTEAALLARERLSDTRAASDALGADLAEFHAALRGRHAYRLPDVAVARPQRAGPDETVPLSRSERRFLAWLCAEPEGASLLPQAELAEAAGITHSALRHAVRHLYEVDYIERFHTRLQGRHNGWRVTRAGLRAALEWAAAQEGGKP